MTDEADSKKEKPGDEFLLREDWGESLVGIVHPVICVLNVGTGVVRVIDVPGFSLADGRWIDDDNVVFVGYEEGIRRLGIIYCTNRKSQLFSCNISEPELKAVSIIGQDADVSVRCPRVSPDGQFMVYLENSVSGPHHKASRLNIYIFVNKKIDNVIDYKITNEPGLDALYIDSLPDRCWYKHHVVVFSAVSQQRKLILGVNHATKNIYRVPFPMSCATVLDYDGSVIVASGSSLNSPPVVFVAELTAEEWRKPHGHEVDCCDGVSGRADHLFVSRCCDC